MRILSPGAVSLNLGFARYVMPAGGRLFIYTPDLEHVIGPFTEKDNEAHGQLWTPIIPGDELIVELSLPYAKLPDMAIDLGAVNHGYIAFSASDKALSGACNVDVVCPEGDDWRDEIRSVGVYTLNGWWTCTGVLVNNTARDGKPYFLTADHCGVNSGNDASMVVYWNYENSYCRPPGSAASGGPGDGSRSQFQSGAVFRADYRNSDMTLVELDDAPDPAFNLFWAGWDRSPDDAAWAVAIHHPGTKEKRISFENDPTVTTSAFGSASPGNGTHIRVIDWDLGTTEGGSSGSPLFNQNRHVIGQLHGGGAACNNDLSDWYGRFSRSWTGNGTPDSRLSDWLDPLNTGAMVLDGRHAATGPAIITGPGPGGSNPPRVKTFDAASGGLPVTDWQAYGVDRFGVHVAAGDLNAGGRDAVVTGPGPGAIFGPHVRAFSGRGEPVPGVSFFAYGTKKFGVHVAAGDIDGDGMAEILTGAGPAQVFGPHVRGWNADGAAVPMGGVNFFAYGTRKWGVRVAAGDIDGDGMAEILTGAGPGPVFGPHVRGWNANGASVPIGGVNFFAYGTSQWGVHPSSGDVDGDGFDDILTGPGPGPAFSARVRGWQFDGAALRAMPGVDFFAYDAKYGVMPGAGDLDGDDFDEILTMPGPGPDALSRVRAWNVDGGPAEAMPAVDFTAYGADIRYGGHVTAGNLF
jgi:hypothetical protein